MIIGGGLLPGEIGEGGEGGEVVEPGDFAVGIARFLSPTDTGVVAHSVDVGGREPKAAIIVSTAGISGSGFGWCIGAMSADDQFFISSHARHFVGAADTGRRADDAAVVGVLGSAAGNLTETAVKDTTPFDSDAVNLNWTLETAQRRTRLLAFAGDDLEVDVQVFSGAAGANAVTVPFEANAIFAFASHSPFDNSLVSTSIFSLGIATVIDSTIVQNSMMGTSTDAADPTEVSGLSNSAALISGTAVANFGVVSDVTETGYTLTLDNTLEVGLVHLKIPTGHRFWADWVQIPLTLVPLDFPVNDTSGNAPGLDFVPSHVMCLTSPQASLDTVDSTGVSPGGSTFIHLWDLPVNQEGVIYGFGWTDEDNEATSDTGSLAGTFAAASFYNYSSDDNGTIDCYADGDAPVALSEGFEIPFTLNSSARYFLIFAVGPE